MTTTKQSYVIVHKLFNPGHLPHGFTQTGLMAPSALLAHCQILTKYIKSSKSYKKKFACP